MTEKLEGKIAVVTGGGRGVGRAISLALGRLGVKVHILARTEREIEAVSEEIRGFGGEAQATAADLSGIDTVMEYLKPRIEAHWGPPQILVNAAGIFGPISLIADSDPQEWINTIMINTVSHYLTCRAFVQGMVDAGWGRIINVTSAASLGRPGSANSAYATSKVALNRFTRHLAAELEGTGVTANVIHPGEVKTKMFEYIKEEAERAGPEARGYQSWAKLVEETGGDPPEKAADLVVSLLGQGATTVNGQFLWVKDGLQTPIETGWD